MSHLASRRPSTRAVTAGIAALAVVAGTMLAAATPSEAATITEWTGGETHSWSNFTNAGGTAGPVYPGQTAISIECVQPNGFRVTDGNTNWYQIAGTSFYVSADAFYNNGATSGGLAGTPYVDPAVPVCGSTVNVTLSQGPPGPAGFWYAVSVSGFGASTSVAVSCSDSRDANFQTTYVATDNFGNGSWSTGICYSGDGPDHWVTINGIASNHVTWVSGSGDGGGSAGGSGTPAPPNPAPPTSSPPATNPPTSPSPAPSTRYATSAKWVSSQYGLTLSITPSGLAQTIGISAATGVMNNALVLAGTRRVSPAVYKSMFAQLQCHLVFKFKTPYNLDTWRPYMNYIEQLGVGPCNPGYPHAIG